MKVALDKEQVQNLVSKNKYLIDPKEKFLSRCIDGRYRNEKDLPALAFPGGDVGELALLVATANTYGFEIDLEKATKTLIEVIGGVENFGFHTGCGHWKQINLDPTAYKLEKEQAKDIQKQLDQLDKKKVNQVILEGDHLEGAVLIVTGDWGVLPRYLEHQVFVYHQTLVDERHQALVSAWLKSGAVKLLAGCDEEYLYQVLSEMAENYLMETVKKLAKGLPIYEVEFDENGGFTLSEVEGVEIKHVGNV